jgi:hypothetical protein
VSVAELATLLKQFEQANPGRDVKVLIRTRRSEVVPRTVEAVVHDFRWTAKEALIVAEEVP